jgi:hypothetical protein
MPLQYGVPLDTPNMQSPVAGRANRRRLSAVVDRLTEA